MSLREKRAWIALLTTLAIWGYYFFEVWRAWDTRTLDGQALLVRFFVCLGVMAVLMLGLNLIAARSRISDFGAPPDEFERRIDQSATTIAHQLRGWLLLGLAAACPWLSTVIAPAFPANPAGATAIFITNAIILGLVVSELVIEIVNIIRFRMIA